MNLYRIEYRYSNGFSDTVLVQAANRIAAYANAMGYDLNKMVGYEG